MKDLFESIFCYISLMKPRVMSLVVFTGFCGMDSDSIYTDPFTKIIAIMCIAFGAGGAASINMWYDRDIDAIMSRTKKRSIVTGKVSSQNALIFGCIISIASISVMYLCVNIFASILLAFTILYYAIIYTIWLKRHSVHNVVIGGVAGALPPMIGSTAILGYPSLLSIAMFVIIFIWTPAHSWALVLYRLKDYRECNIPMLPIIKGINYTKWMILIYNILTVICSLLPYFLLQNGLYYIIIALPCNVVLLYYTVKLIPTEEKDLGRRSRSLFLNSIIYLFIIFFSIKILS